MTAVEQGASLAKLTTIGVGGPARALARPRSVAELREALGFARAEGLGVLTVGLGSNLLAGDAGVDALVLRLEGELAAVEVVETGLIAGGAATNAVCLHRARDAGLGGLEFACAIPGTAGGGVVMNAGAYGRDWSDVLVRALVVTADGEKWVTPDDLGLAYRHSALGEGDVVARVEYRLGRRPPADIRATVAELDRARKATQPTNKRTFGSVFNNPAGETRRGEDARALRPQGPSHRRRDDLSGTRELHRERRRRDECRLRRADAGGAAASARGVRHRTRARGRLRPAA